MQPKLRRRMLIIKSVALFVLAHLLALVAFHLHSLGGRSLGRGALFLIALIPLLAYALLDLFIGSWLIKWENSRLEQFADQIQQGDAVTASEFPELQPIVDAFKFQQLQLQQESDKIRWIIQHIPGGLVTINVQEQITFAVCPAFDNLGIPVSDLVGSHISRYHQMIGCSREDSPMINALHKGVKSRHISKIADHYFEAVNTPMISSTGTIDGAVCLFVDVTERVRQETEMKRLEKLRLVGQLAAGLSHEIRNPMTVIRGFLQMYADKPTHQQEKEQFQLLIGEIDRVVRIVQEFLALTHDRGGELRLQSLTQIIGQVAPLLAGEAAINGITLQLDLHDTPSILLNDSDIKQMLLNLYRNAVEACQVGGTVQVSTGVDEHGRPFLQVSDDGCGMPSQVLEQLGTPFVSTKEEGTGLGLPVCLSVAQAHAAELSFHSAEQGQGTVVVVRFPLTIPAWGTEVV